MDSNDEQYNNVMVKNVDFDILLKQNIAKLFVDGINQRINNNVIESFTTFKILFDFINIDKYKFGYKEQMAKLIENLTPIINEANSGDVSRRANDNIILFDKQAKAVIAVDSFRNLVMNAYADLGLWFYAKNISGDIDADLSKHNFGTNETTCQDKRDELSSIDSKELVLLLTDNMVHKVFSWSEVKNGFLS